LNIDLTPYKGLIFDMDGTLVDTMPSHLEAWRMTAAHHGFSFDYDWFYQLGGVPTLKTVEIINHTQGLSLLPADVYMTKRDMFESMDVRITPIKQTHELLLEHRSDKKIAIGTGADRYGADRILAASQLESLLDTLVCADDVENHKPSPDTFLLAAERLGLQPQECVVFEDTQTGLQAAKSAGMSCYLVVDGEIKQFHPV